MKNQAAWVSKFPHLCGSCEKDLRWACHSHWCPSNQLYGNAKRTTWLDYTKSVQAWASQMLPKPIQLKSSKTPKVK